MVAVLFLWPGSAMARKNKTASQSAASDTEFSVAVAERVMDAFRRALVDENQRRALAVFDQAMPGYTDLQTQLQSLFQRYDTVRVYLHITKAEEVANAGANSANGSPRGTATADFSIEATPPDTSYLPVRRDAELRLTFGRVGKQWKIVDFEPRNLFAGF